MNAPTEPAIAAINMKNSYPGTGQTIAIALLYPSPTNPRKRFDEAKLNELAESIKTQGVLQPLLVRQISTPSGWPFPSKEKELPRYEIVAGERRYRAAKLAGLAEVPCFVRDLTDVQVLHAQVIENLQRDDLHPLEEAEGYEKLIELHGSTADSLAGEIGKSKGYIYARLKLCALVTEARTAFFDGLLDASTALLIARIPVAKLQIQALKAITKKDWQDNVMSFRSARDLIQRDYMTDLDKAIFEIKDAALLAKAGACTDCTKRTGNQPELFDDVQSKDVCTDTVCFAMKKTAHILAIQKEAEAKGHAVITGDAAKKIMPYGEHSVREGYARLDDECDFDEKGRSWKQVLGKKAFEPARDTGKPQVQKTLIEDTSARGSGNLVETVSIESAIKALREMGVEVKPKQDGAAGWPFGKSAHEKEQVKLKARAAEANHYRTRLFDALHQKIAADMNKPQPFVAPGLYRILAEHRFQELREYFDTDLCARLARIYLPDAPVEEDDEDNEALLAAFEAAIPKLTTQQHFLLLVDITMLDENHVGTYNCEEAPAKMTSIAKEIGIDAAAIEKEAIAEIKAAAKQAAKTSKPTTKEKS